MKKLALGLTCLSLATVLSGCNLINKIGELIEGGEEVPITETEARSRLITLGETEGFLMTYNFEDKQEDGEESGQITFGMKNNIVWYVFDDGDAAAVKKENDHYSKYDYDNGNWVLDADDDFTQEDYDHVINEGSEYLFFAHSLNGALKSDGEGTVQDRNCWKYKFLFSEVLKTMKMNMNMELYVEKQLGITMKVVVDGDVDDDSVALNMEITSFVTGSSVVAPVLA